jgi:formylglycine-generating enzyme required for sulfatase activity
MFASESPTGFFERCVSAEGIYDMTGNLWEWNADQGNEFSSEARFHQGAGWRTVAEQHRDGDMQCSRTMTIPESSAAMHHSSMVGFRCCQTVQ